MIRTKHIQSLKWWACLSVLTLSLCLSVTAQASTKKDEKRLAYVVKGLKLDKNAQAKFNPLFTAYRKELREAKEVYDAPKRRMKSRIDAGTLSQNQAQSLLNAHWLADEKEVAVKKKYTPLFVKLLGAKKTYQMFRLANDKEATK